MIQTLFVRHCREYCDGIITVTDEEITKAAQVAFNNGLVVEPSGAAALAAFISNKIVRDDRQRLVMVLTGGNVTPEEFTSRALELRYRGTARYEKAKLQARRKVASKDM